MSISIHLKECCDHEVIGIFELEDGGRTILLHNRVNDNHRRRYREKALPILEGSTIYSEVNELWVLPNNCITLGPAELPNLQNYLESPTQWFRMKRDTKCSVMGGYVAEYSFRNAVIKGLSSQERDKLFLRELALNWAEVLGYA